MSSYQEQHYIVRQDLLAQTGDIAARFLRPIPCTLDPNCSPGEKSALSFEVPDQPFLPNRYVKIILLGTDHVPINLDRIEQDSTFKVWRPIPIEVWRSFVLASCLSFDEDKPWGNEAMLTWMVRTVILVHGGARDESDE